MRACQPRAGHVQATFGRGRLSSRRRTHAPARPHEHENDEPAESPVPRNASVQTLTTAASCSRAFTIRPPTTARTAARTSTSLPASARNRTCHGASSDTGNRATSSSRGKHGRAARLHSAARRYDRSVAARGGWYALLAPSSPGPSSPEARRVRADLSPIAVRASGDRLAPPVLAVPLGIPSAATEHAGGYSHGRRWRMPAATHDPQYPAPCLAPASCFPAQELVQRPAETCTAQRSTARTHGRRPACRSGMGNRLTPYHAQTSSTPPEVAPPDASGLTLASLHRAMLHAGCGNALFLLPRTAPARFGPPLAWLTATPSTPVARVVPRVSCRAIGGRERANESLQRPNRRLPPRVGQSCSLVRPWPPARRAVRAPPA